MNEQKLWSDLGETLLAGRVTREEPARRLYVLPDGSLPEGVIYVTDTDMLMSIVRWARKNRTALVPASSAPPHFQACLNLPEAAWIVDFSRMKRVIKINRRNRVALFEAGVSFEELAPMARAEGLRLMVPLLPRQGKSILASYLDREPVIYPKYQWDISDPLLCLEAVYGTGDLFRTGNAAGPGTIQQQWAAGDFQKSPMGPGQNDWMKIIQGAQGGIALVTWCSAKCEARPLEETLFVAGADHPEPLIEASFEMFHKKLTDIHFLADAGTLAGLVAGDANQRKKALAAARPWNLVFSVSGIEHFARERRDYFAEQTKKVLKSRKARAADPPLMPGPDLLKKLAYPNVLSVEEKNRLMSGGAPAPHWRDLAMGAHARVYFQTTLERVPKFFTLFNGLTAKAGVEDNRVSRYVQPQVGGRCCHVEFIVAARAGDPADVKKIRNFCDSAAEPLIEAGAFFSRPHGAWAGPAMKKATSTCEVFRKVKAIFDPDGVLSPGRLTLGGNGHA